jgi:hypothetical protein
VLALVVAGCAEKAPSDPHERLLFELCRAAGDQDADAFAEQLAAGFAGEGGLAKGDVANELRRYFALYESVEVATAGLEVEPAGGGPTVLRFRASFSGKPRNVGGLAGMLPDAARFRFEIAVAEEQGRLRVVRGSWQRVEGP